MAWNKNKGLLFAGHDETCSTHKFYKCLNQKFKDNNIKFSWFHAGYIALGGGIGCWVKYTSKMFKRIK